MLVSRQQSAKPHMQPIHRAILTAIYTNSTFSRYSSVSREKEEESKGGDISVFCIQLPKRGGWKLGICLIKNLLIMPINLAHLELNLKFCIIKLDLNSKLCRHR